MAEGYRLGTEKEISIRWAPSSDSAGRNKRMHVYLPPGYNAGSQKDYPVLYLNHGGGQDDSSWTSVSPGSGGSANWILDNLIADTGFWFDLV